MFIELMQPPQEQGQAVQTITAVIEKISMAVKRPLDPMFAVIMGDITLPCIGSYDDFLQKVKSAGLAVFDSPEGGKVVVNPSHVMTFMSPQLGTYALMLGKTGAVVKATRSDIEDMFSPKSSILT